MKGPNWYWRNPRISTSPTSPFFGWSAS